MKTVGDLIMNPGHFQMRCRPGGGTTSIHVILKEVSEKPRGHFVSSVQISRDNSRARGNHPAALKGL